MTIIADTVLSLQAALLAQPGLEETAATLATRLAADCAVDRVAVGLIEHGRMRVAALSHGTGLDAQQELTQLLVAAMDEAADQAATVSLPALGGFPRIALAHTRLRAAGGAQGSLCTIPIVYQEQVAGAVCFERFATDSLTAEECANWEHVVHLAGPLLILKARGEAPWLARAQAAWSRQWRRLTTPGDAAFKWLAGGVTLALIVALLVPVPYRVSAPARLEGAVQRALVAASDGFVQQTSVRPGDKVKAGQVIAELAQQDLQLERSKRESEFSQHAGAYSAAFARADRATLMVSQARMSEARAQLDLVEKQLERTQIKAPFDGVIISGDLTQTLGAPVQRGSVLMVLAPADRYRLIVEVDERDVRDVRPGAKGRVALAAMPQAPLDFKVDRVTPISATRDGRHFFEVEGKLEGENATLRPGLQGVARITADSRPLAAMALGRLWNWLRMRLWSWGWLG